MHVHKMLDYLKWSDLKLLEQLKKLEEQELNSIVGDRSGSIRDRLLHLAEEYTAWLYDISKKDWQDEIKTYQDMNCDDLADILIQRHEDWKEFIMTTDKDEFEIDEGDGLVVPINLEEVIYNLVNHTSYHRGQIALLLRMLDFDVSLTDYYWYKIEHL